MQININMLFGWALMIIENTRYPSWEFEYLIRKKKKRSSNLVGPSMFSKSSESHQGVVEERPCIVKTCANIEELGKLASWYNPRRQKVIDLNF